MEMLTVKDVKKSFDGVEILKGISLTVEKGGVLAIIGPCLLYTSRNQR